MIVWGSFSALGGIFEIASGRCLFCAFRREGSRRCSFSPSTCWLSYFRGCDRAESGIWIPQPKRRRLRRVSSSSSARRPSHSLPQWYKSISQWPYSFTEKEYEDLRHGIEGDLKGVALFERSICSFRELPDDSSLGIIAICNERRNRSDSWGVLRIVPGGDYK